MEGHVASISFINAVITNGYILPFVKPCLAFHAKNIASSIRNYDFVTNAINELLKARYIRQVGDIPHC